MVNKYKVTEIESDMYSVLITILDRNIDIDNLAKKLFKLFNVVDKNILFDTALSSGMNGYRFVDAHPEGSFYVKPEKHIIEMSDNILKEHPDSLRNSILTRRQIDDLLGNIEVEDVLMYHMSYSR